MKVVELDKLEENNYKIICDFCSKLRHVSMGYEICGNTIYIICEHCIDLHIITGDDSIFLKIYSANESNK